ncbi:MAG: YkgJ family cysteine cluster protein [Candidatus Omnitrophica bacterium]|jgi:Fe-S-cluster containining protein|nr:YkgJ family cysteine cluster protein [Candidatus Omnitrophota bacterium]
MKPKKGTQKIDCLKCREQHSCCNFGAWVDLDEAKKILALGLKGDFYHLEKDGDYPSGYRVGTSVEDNRCSFLTPKGLCSIHKVNYDLKPAHCKEFPYEGGKLSPFADVLCSVVKSKKRKKNREI